MKASVEYITPEQATLMLKNNPNNRKLQPFRVAKLADQMKRGAWRTNGSSIVMNGEVLLDGQHRLSAIIESGLTFPFVVVRGVPPEAFYTIDTGRSRTLADVLLIKGEARSAALSAAVRLHIAFSSGAPAGVANVSRDWTYGELVEYAEQHPEIGRSIEFIEDLNGKTPVSVGAIAALHSLFSLKDKSLADHYVESIMKGTRIEPGSIEEMVFGRLAGIASDYNRKMMTHRNKAELVVRGWNHLREGTRPNSWIKVGGKTKKGGKVKFPEIK